MANISIFCCSKVTNKMGCSSAECLYKLKIRKGDFERYKSQENLELLGLLQCPGCNEQPDYEKLIGRVEYLSSLDVDIIHFSNCVNNFCTYRYGFQMLLKNKFPDIEIVMGEYKLNVL